MVYKNIFTRIKIYWHYIGYQPILELVFSSIGQLFNIVWSFPQFLHLDYFCNHYQSLYLKIMNNSVRGYFCHVNVYIVSIKA